MFFNYFHDSTVPGAGLPRQIPIQHDFVELPILTMFSWRFLGVQPVPARKPGTNVLDNASLAARVPSATPVTQLAQKRYDESIIRQHVFLTRSSPGTRLQKFVSISVQKLMQTGRPQLNSFKLLFHLEPIHCETNI